jgi:hypothetical protein
MAIQPVPTINTSIHHRFIEVQGLKIFYRDAGPPDAPASRTGGSAESEWLSALRRPL